LAKREELTERIYACRSQMIVDWEEHDEAEVAHQAFNRELVCMSMENDIRILAAVELSLHCLKTGKYGRCGSCGGKIPTTRLMALPWIHVCVGCAGGAFRQHKRALEKKLASESNADPRKVIQFQKIAAKGC
jgi:RNA polymerase-binding transcription factor DksA